MRKVPDEQSKQIRAPAPWPIGSETGERGSTEHQALVALARLLGRQAAHNIILQQQETGGRACAPSAGDT